MYDVSMPCVLVFIRIMFVSRYIIFLQHNFVHNLTVFVIYRTLNIVSHYILYDVHKTYINVDVNFARLLGAKVNKCCVKYVYI